MAKPFPICGVNVYPGETREVELPVSEIYTTAEVSIPVRIVRGWRDGPRVFVTAAVHGDEINGTEVLRELMYDVNLQSMRGTLVCVPVVNLFGFLNHSRYLPDRRDLNRFFPGNPGGPLASRIAHRVFSEIVRRCEYGIDLHTASARKVNLPHVRVAPSDRRASKLARAFGTEVVIHDEPRRGSLRAAAGERGIIALTYEGGQPLRFERPVVERGLTGILNVLSALGMIERQRIPPLFQIVARRRTWVRAERGGILDLRARPGDLLAKDQEIGVTTNPFGRERHTLQAPFAGLVIGATTLPSVNPGDAVVHVVKLTRSRQRIETLLAGRNLLDIHRSQRDSAAAAAKAESAEAPKPVRARARRKR